MYLVHHGIKGQKWGVRRFQNKDGSLTSAGLKRHAKQVQKELNKSEKQTARLYGLGVRAAASKQYADLRTKKLTDKYEALNEKQKSGSKGQRLQKKAQKWMERSDLANKRFSEIDTAYYKSAVKTSELYKKVENDPRFLTSFGRGTVSSVGSFKYRRSTYDVDTGASPDEVTYDKTKVRVNTEKERKRNSKRRTERAGYGFNKYYFY